MSLVSDVLDRLKANFHGEDQGQFTRPPRTIGASRIVKLRVAELAEELRNPPPQGKWNKRIFHGYATMDWALRGFVRELAAHVPLDPGGTLSGHADGVWRSVLPGLSVGEGGRIYVVEHKWTDGTSITWPPERVREFARRQAVLDLALMWNHVERMRRTRFLEEPMEVEFEIDSRWNNGAKTWTWLPTDLPGGVVVCLTIPDGEDGPLLVQEEYTPEQLASHLAFYKRKAEVVLRVLDGDPEAALEWERNLGATEFTRSLAEVEAPALGKPELLSAIAEAGKLREQIDVLEKLREAKRAEVKRALAEAQVRSLVAEVDGRCWKGSFIRKKNPDHLVRGGIEKLRELGLGDIIKTGGAVEYVDVCEERAKRED